MVQSLVLARDGILWPEFGSIEEYLGLPHAGARGSAGGAGGSADQPEQDDAAVPWIEFCIDAHFDQARQRLPPTPAAAAIHHY